MGRVKRETSKEEMASGSFSLGPDSLCGRDSYKVQTNGDYLKPPQKNTAVEWSSGHRGLQCAGELFGLRCLSEKGIWLVNNWERSHLSLELRAAVS